MELSKFLTLCGMFLGFAAVLLFSRAIYSKPDIFLRSLPHYSASAWPSAEILSSGADQKADAQAAWVLIFIALIIQAFSLFCGENTMICKNLFYSILLMAAVVAVCSITVYQARIGIKYQFEQALKKRAAYDFIESCFTERSQPQFSGIRAIATEYFKLKKEQNENDVQFVKRFSEFVDFKVAKDADFSKFK